MQGGKGMVEIVILSGVSLLWSIYLSLLVDFSWQKRSQKIKLYQQISLTVMPQQEQKFYGFKDSRGLKRALQLLDKSEKLLELDSRLYVKLERMLRLMGQKKGGQEAFAQALLTGLLGALPILTVPVLMGNWTMLLLYPCFVLLITWQECDKIKRAYQRWQQELIYDIPEVIDRLRISFAAGRDYYSALLQAGTNCRSAMVQVLDQLINDLQTLGSKEALRLFVNDFDLPMMSRLATALNLAIDSGYSAAEAYFVNIEADILTLRQAAVERMVREKPEKVNRLYALLFLLSSCCLILKGWEIFREVSSLFV
jgi:Flp pilus assembly protein TadB